MKRTIDNATRLAVLVAATLLGAPAEAGSIQCWTNRDGVRECGNVVPPEYAQKETKTLAGSGVTLSVQQRAKTEEELAEERLRAEEAREQARIAALQSEYDRILLATYASADDIVAVRDRKLATIEGNISLTRAGLEEHYARQAELRKQAAAAERAGRAVPDQVLDEMRRQREQVVDKQAYIGARQAEIAAIRAEYRAALERYRELRAER